MPGDHKEKKKKKQLDIRVSKLKERIGKIKGKRVVRDSEGRIMLPGDEPTQQSIKNPEFYGEKTTGIFGQGGKQKKATTDREYQKKKTDKLNKRLTGDFLGDPDKMTPTPEQIEKKKLRDKKEAAAAKKQYEKRHRGGRPRKAELIDVTKEQKNKKKDKEKLLSKSAHYNAESDPEAPPSDWLKKYKKERKKTKKAKGVAPNYNNPSKVKKNPPPQGPKPNAETPEEIMQNAEIVSRKNDTYIAKLKQRIAEKRKKDYQKIEAEEKEEAEEARKHKHLIEFKGHTGQYYKRASLVSSEGRYAKYWLLNAKQTNGNGWGVSQQSIAKNIRKFVGRPLVVTAKSWVPDSEYGDQFEHPYLPTNDINKVLNHQEKFRIGSIVDIIEKNGDYFANIEINQRFANMILPPFCSPAIFQNNPAEPEGQISDWEALHLAALMEDPAYGSRIALLRGTCIGTKDQCSVQFKSAKQQAKMICTKGIRERLAGLFPKEKRHWEEQGYKTKPDWYGDTCPGCGQEMQEYPALSREDNKTLICTDCGNKEAFGDFTNVKGKTELEGHEENKSKRLRESRLRARLAVFKPNHLPSKDSVEDLTDEYEGKGKVALPRVSEGTETPRIVRHKGTILQPGKREAYPLHTDYDFKSEFQHNFEKKRPFKGEAKDWGKKKALKEIDKTELEDVGDIMSISENEARKLAKIKKNEKTRVKKASDDWSSTTDTDFFRKPFKARKLSFDMTGLDYMDSLHDKASWNAGQKAMERFKNELTHPFSRKYAYDVLDNHAYNSGLAIDNNYPDLEGYIDKNDSKSLQNLLEGHNKDILEHADYRAEEAFGFVEDEPLPPTSEGEALGRKLFEPFKKMKDGEYAKIPDRRGDMLRTKGILKDYTNDVSGSIMKDFGTHRRNQLGAKKNDIKQRLAIGTRVSPTTKRVKRVKKVLDYEHPYQGPEMPTTKHPKTNIPKLTGPRTTTGNERRRKVTKKERNALDSYIKDDKKIDPRKAKLKQRLAVIEQQKLAVSYKRKIDEVMDSFNTWEYKKEKTPKGLKKKDDRFEPLFTKHKGGIRGVRHLGNKFQYSGHYKGTGTTIPKGAKDKFIPHVIMEKTPKGIIIDNYAYDTASTYRYWNKAGISTKRKGDKLYVGGKLYDFEQGGKMLIPYKNITAPIVPKKKYIGTVRPRQHEMSQQTRLEATGDIKGIPEDPTRIQPRDQRIVNKITGLKTKIPRRKILGTESHHLFDFSKYPQMDKMKGIGVGVSHRTHQEMMNPRKFTAKLRQRLGIIRKKGKHELKTRDERETIIDNFYDGKTSSQILPISKPSEHGKRFMEEKIKSREKDKKLGREHKQLDEGKANKQFIETGEPINPNKFKGKKLKNKRKYAKISPFPNPKNSFTIRLKKGLTDIGWEPRYVNYAIQNQINQGWAKKYQMGTAQQFIRKHDLNTMDIYDANTGVNMKLGEIADVLPGTVEPRSGDTIFQRTGSPGKTQYFE